MFGPRVAILPGSLRRSSLHRRLAGVLAASLTSQGVAGEVIELAEHTMPLYDGDEEAATGHPASARSLRERLGTFDGLVICSPEHNGGPSALLKNTIDWVTRVDRSTFRPLLIGLAATSPGERGAVTGLAAMRRMCEHMRLDVAPIDLSIPFGGDAFGEDEAGRAVLVRCDDIERAGRFVTEYIAELRARVRTGPRG